MYLVVVTFLTFSALMYLTARQAALHRFRRPPARPARGTGPPLQRLRRRHHRPGAQLRRRTPVVRGTLWSAALQEFPDLQIVLLIDDPPNPERPGGLAKLDGRAALRRNSAALRPRTAPWPPWRPSGAAQRLLFPTSPQSWPQLIAEYEAAAEWLEAMAEASRSTTTSTSSSSTWSSWASPANCG